LSFGEGKKEFALAGKNLKSLEELIPAVIRELGHEWQEVQKVVVKPEVA